VSRQVVHLVTTGLPPQVKIIAHNVFFHNKLSFNAQWLLHVPPGMAKIYCFLDSQKKKKQKLFPYTPLVGRGRTDFSDYVEKLGASSSNWFRF